MNHSIFLVHGWLIRALFRVSVAIVAAYIPSVAIGANGDGIDSLAGGNVIVLRNSYTPPRDAQVGTIVQDKEGVALDDTISTRPRTCRVYKAMSVNGTLVPGMDKTYSTNVPGIGVRFYTTAGWAGDWELGPVNTDYLVPPNSSSRWRASIELIVTGPVSGGVLTSLPSLDVSMRDCYGNNIQAHVTIAAGSQISAGTCLVTTPSVVLNLPPVTASRFNGAGATVGDTPLRVGLSCSPGADVYITLTDSTDPGNQTDRLTPARGSTAVGVMMRLLYHSTPVAYGPDSAIVGNINQWRVGTSSAVTEVPLTAQYISTGAVTPGVLTGLATFTMSYQ